MATYSFIDVSASIIGPGGALNLGQGSGSSEEGITIEPNEDINTMTIGADGTVMHSLHANKSGTVTARLLKTSPVNQKLMLMYSLQTASAANHGQNTISISNAHLQDVITCTQVAFKRVPNLAYAKDGGTVDWVFDAGSIDRVLGAVA